MTTGKCFGDYSGLGYTEKTSKANKKKMSNAFVRKTADPSQNGEEGCSNTLKEKKIFVPIFSLLQHSWPH